MSTAALHSGAWPSCARAGGPRAGVRHTAPALAATLLAVLVTMASPPAAGAQETATTITAVAGNTQATLSFSHDPHNVTGPYSQLRISISGGGHSRYSHPVHAVLCGAACWPAVGISSSPVLRVADIERNGSPDVLLNLYSGGAHCCFITQIYRYDARAGTYAVSQRDFFDAGARLRTIAGRPVFVSADDRFAYEFAAFAFSGLPLQIWAFAGGRFRDVTDHYPALIATDARRQYAAFVANRHGGFGLGFIAAWAADEDRLGHSSHVARTLAAQLRGGALRSAGGLSWKSGSAFVAQLQRFLAKTGYRS